MSQHKQANQQNSTTAYLLTNKSLRNQSSESTGEPDLSPALKGTTSSKTPSDQLLGRFQSFFDEEVPSLARADLSFDSSPSNCCRNFSFSFSSPSLSSSSSLSLMCLSHTQA